MSVISAARVGPELSRETRLLLTVARRFAGLAEADELSDVLREDLDWPLALAQAEREGVAGLVARELARLPLARGVGLPRDPWQDALRTVAATNMAALAELSAMRQMLRREGRRVILLKGAALLHTVYREHVGLRPLGDVDLLVRPSDLPRLEEWLRARGYEPFTSLFPFFSRGAVAFDLHLEIVGSDWTARKASAFRLDPEVLRRDAAPLEADDPSTLVLSPVHQQLHLVIHGLKHSYSRLMWLVDLALTLRDASWPALLEGARCAGATRPLAYALDALEALLGLTAPPGIRDELPSLGPLERAFVRLVVRRTGVETAGDFMVALSISGIGRKAAYLGELTFPGPRVLARHYPATPHWLLYPRRLLRLLTWALREGGRVLRLSP